MQLAKIFEHVRHRVPPASGATHGSLPGIYRWECFKDLVINIVSMVEGVMQKTLCHHAHDCLRIQDRRPPRKR